MQTDYKTSLGFLGPWLHRIIRNVWYSETVPSNWSKVVLRPLFNKGDNDRDIYLINVTAKVFGAKTIQQGVTSVLTPNKMALGLDGVAQATVICFVDFVSAFDFVVRDSLWRRMATDCMPAKRLRLIKTY